MLKFSIDCIIVDLKFNLILFIQCLSSNRIIIKSCKRLVKNHGSIGQFEIVSFIDKDFVIFYKKNFKEEFLYRF